MKFLALLAVLCPLLTACRQRSAEETLQLEAEKVVGSDNTVRRSLSDVWINTASFCPSKTDVLCAKQLDNIQRQLNDMNPVPVPQSGERIPVSVVEATILYKRFVADHTGEPILAIFQQLYPRILLNKYGVLNSSDYELISYYTQQLTTSNALDFTTRANALTRLKGHLPAEQYKLLLDETMKAATAEVTREQNEMARLRRVIAVSPKQFIWGDPTTHPGITYRATLEYYESSTLSADLARLKAL